MAVAHARTTAASSAAGRPRHADTRIIIFERYYRQMPMIATPPENAVDKSELEAAACLFRSLSDPTRLMIVQHLNLGEHRVVDLTEHLGLAQSTVSVHLACLFDCGLLSRRTQGRASVYSLASTPLNDLLAAAEQVLDATGYAVTLCPEHTHSHAHPRTDILTD